MLRTSILRVTILAAALAAPAVASANVRAQTGLPSNNSPSPFANENSFSQAAIGGGLWGSGTSNVTGPGRAPVNNDSHGPINDVDVVVPSNGNNKTAVTPKPVR